MTEQFFVVTEQEVGQESISTTVISRPFKNVDDALEYLDKLLMGNYLGAPYIKNKFDSKIIKGEYIPISIV